MQGVIVGIILLAALFYIIRHARRSVTGKGGCGCGCSSCRNGKNASCGSGQIASYREIKPR